MWRAGGGVGFPVPRSQSLCKNSNSIAGTEVTRLQLPGKSRGLAVEEVDLPTSAPTFQTGSQRLARTAWTMESGSGNWPVRSFE